MKPPNSDRLDAYVAYLEASCPPAIEVWAAATEDEFCAAVERAVESALMQLESGARRCGSMDELGLSWLLSELLTAASIPAVSEGYHNGHVDLTIKHPAGRPFLVLGECKIYRGYKHHCAGCKQLLVRYSSGRSARTFCLDFFQRPKMYEKLQRLRDAFNASRPLEQIDDAADHAIKGAFVTLHKHFTAANVEVLHLGCNVYHPENAPLIAVPDDDDADALDE